jgi:hypothetical protein
MLTEVVPMEGALHLTWMNMQTDCSSVEAERRTEASDYEVAFSVPELPARAAPRAEPRRRGECGVPDHRDEARSEREPHALSRNTADRRVDLQR